MGLDEMAMLSNLDLIRRVPLFAELSSAQAESLAGAVDKQRFKRGDYIVERGQTSNALYIILSGRARVMMKDSKGREVILAVMRTGDHIGEISLIDGMPLSATGVCGGWQDGGRPCPDGHRQSFCSVASD